MFDQIVARIAGRFVQPEQVGAGRGPGLNWAWIHTGTDSHHLLIRRNRTTSELAFYLCRSPTEVPLSELVRVAGARWSIEDHETAPEY